MTAYLRRALGALFLSAIATAASAADRTIIVLDASGSMWGQIDGKPKLEIARETLRSVLQSLPPDTELGLMAYGHREKGSCTDIELVVPPATGTAAAITQAADAMRFQGKTPLTAAVRQAAEALGYDSRKSTVVLVTDGVETCEADPCALGKELEQEGVDFTAHVVGFGLTAEEGREVSCLAENTGGKFLQASDSQGLREALAATVAEPAPAAPAEPAVAASEPAPPPPAQDAPAVADTSPEASEPVTPPAASEPATPPAASEPVTPPAASEPVTPPAAAEMAPQPEPDKPDYNFAPSVRLAAGGEPVKDPALAWELYEAKPDGSRGPSIAFEYDDYRATLAPGDYVVVARLGVAKAEQKLTVQAGQVYTPDFVLGAGTLVVRPRASAGGEISSTANVLVEYPGGSMPATSYGETRMVLPAGEQRLTVALGGGERTETFRLAEGQTLERDVVVGIGHVTVNAVYAAGGDKVTESGLDVEIFTVQPDGSRARVTTTLGPEAKFDLSPGEYIAVVKLGEAEVEQKFSVEAAERKDLTVNLDAGILSISAPGAKSVKVFKAAGDTGGERQQVASSPSEGLKTTLPVGSYVIEADRQDGGQIKTMTVSVSGGARVDVTVQ
jgi:Ca-activated chloride channel family protein